jgi:hypothetical protein
VSALENLLLQGPMSMRRFAELTAAGRPGNLHDQAWDVADQLIQAMRER